MAREKRWATENGHPSERDLLLLVNGELRARAADKVQAHLHGCWSCAMKRDRLVSSISAFMDGRQALFSDLEFPQGHSRRFETRLKRLASQPETAKRPRYSEQLNIKLRRYRVTSFGISPIFRIYTRNISVHIISASYYQGSIQRSAAASYSGSTATLTSWR